MAVLHDDILPAVQGSARQLTQGCLVQSERHEGAYESRARDEGGGPPHAVKSWIAFLGSLRPSGGFRCHLWQDRNGLLELDRPALIDVGGRGLHGCPCVDDHAHRFSHGNDHGRAGERVCGCDSLTIHGYERDCAHAYVDASPS